MARKSILDASAVLRFFDDEAGADRVEDAFRACCEGTGGLAISAVQWGEIAGMLRRRLGQQAAAAALDAILPAEAEIVPATAERAVRAAALKADHGIAYADAFAVELALSTPEAVLITADYGFKAVEKLIQIEFLPGKQDPCTASTA
jgi:predicted nucleic acid-binding protein